MRRRGRRRMRTRHPSRTSLRPAECAMSTSTTYSASAPQARRPPTRTSRRWPCPRGSERRSRISRSQRHTRGSTLHTHGTAPSRLSPLYRAGITMQPTHCIKSASASTSASAEAHRALQFLRRLSYGRYACAVVLSLSCRRRDGLSQTHTQRTLTTCAVARSNSSPPFGRPPLCTRCSAPALNPWTRRPPRGPAPPPARSTCRRCPFARTLTRRSFLSSFKACRSS